MSKPLTPKQLRQALYAAGIGGPHHTKRLTEVMPAAAPLAKLDWIDAGQHAIVVSPSREPALILSGVLLLAQVAIHGIEVSVLLRALVQQERSKIGDLLESDVITLLGACDSRPCPYSTREMVDLEGFIMDSIHGRGTSFIFQTDSPDLHWYSPNFLSYIFKNSVIVP